MDEPKPDNWDDREYLDEFKSDFERIETRLSDESINQEEKKELLAILDKMLNPSYKGKWTG